MTRPDNRTKVKHKLSRLPKQEEFTYKEVCDFFGLNRVTNVKDKITLIKLLREFLEVTELVNGKLNLKPITEITWQSKLKLACELSPSSFTCKTYEDLCKELNLVPSYESFRETQLKEINRYFEINYDLLGYTLIKRDKSKGLYTRNYDYTTIQRILTILEFCIDEATIFNFFNTTDLYYNIEFRREDLIRSFNIVTDLYFSLHEAEVYNQLFGHCNAAQVNYIRNELEKQLSHAIDNVVTGMNKLGVAEVYSTYKVNFVNGKSTLADKALFDLIQQARHAVAVELNLNTALSYDFQVNLRGKSSDFYAKVIKHEKMFDLQVVNIRKVRVIKIHKNIKKVVLDLKVKLDKLKNQKLSDKAKLNSTCVTRVERESNILNRLIAQTPTSSIDELVNENYLLTQFTDDFSSTLTGFLTALLL